MKQSVPLHLRRLISARAATGSGLESESTGPATITPTGADEVLHRAAALMSQVPGDEIGDPNEYQRALNIFLARADKGLRTMLPGSPHIEPDASFALEAVIRADGTRPSFLVKQSACDPNHPLAGDWKDRLTADPKLLSKRIAAVGRIAARRRRRQQLFRHRLAGGFRDKGLALTNLHVLEQMWGRLANSVLPDGSGGYRFLGAAAFIDFAAETQSLEKRQFQIVGGSPSGTDGPGFRRLDVAVLRIEPVTQGPARSPELPEAIPVVADIDFPAGNTASSCFVGYPGPPPYASGIHDKVDWAWVNATLFGNRFGVKRLAPGAASTPLDAMAGDPHGWVFGHDATTLGGSSGSPALDWYNTRIGGVGLHFAGATSDTNCAHAIVRIREQLTRLGVPVTDPE